MQRQRVLQKQYLQVKLGDLRNQSFVPASQQVPESGSEVLCAVNLGINGIQRDQFVQLREELRTRSTRAQQVEAFDVRAGENDGVVSVAVAMLYGAPFRRHVLGNSANDQELGVLKNTWRVEERRDVTDILRKIKNSR